MPFGGLGTAAILGLGGIGAGTSIFSSLFGASQINKAKQAQMQAAQKAGDNLKAAIGTVNPSIGEAATNAGNNVTGQALNAGKNVVDAAHTAGDAVRDQATRSAALLNPYADAGADASAQLRAGMADGGKFMHAPTLQELQMDPGYAFRLAQGQKALEQSGAARGGATGGTAIKDTLNFGQGLASQEYNNAFNRYQTDITRQAGLLGDVSKTGLVAAGNQGDIFNQGERYAGDRNIDANKTAGTWNINGAQYAGDKTTDAANAMANNVIGGARTAGDYLIGGSNANAAGTVASTNLLTNGIGNAFNQVTGNLSLADMLKKIKLGQTSPGDIPGNTPGSGTTIPTVPGYPSPVPIVPDYPTVPRGGR